MVPFVPQTSQVVNGVTVYVSEYTVTGKILRCSGNTKPTDGSDGFAHGCQWTDITNSPNVNCVYTNAGTEASCDFNLLNS